MSWLQNQGLLVEPTEAPRSRGRRYLSVFTAALLTLIAALLWPYDWANAILVPILVSVLTLTVVRGYRKWVVLSCCSGLGLLLYFGDSAAVLGIADRGARRVLWSSSLVFLLVIPFAYSLAAFRARLKEHCETKNVHVGRVVP